MGTDELHADGWNISSIEGLVGTEALTSRTRAAKVLIGSASKVFRSVATLSVSGSSAISAGYPYLHHRVYKGTVSRLEFEAIIRHVPHHTPYFTMHRLHHDSLEGGPTFSGPEAQCLFAPYTLAGLRASGPS